MAITSEDVKRSLSNSPQLTFEITDDRHSPYLQDEPRPVALVSSQRCFLARGWRRELLFPYNNAKTQTEQLHRT